MPTSRASSSRSTTSTAAKPTAATLKKTSSLKSYLTRISNATKAHSLASFSAFPEETTFDGQDRGEHIVLLLRQHPAVFIPQLLMVLVMMIVPFLVIPVLKTAQVTISPGDVAFGLGVLLLWVMLIISVVIVNFFRWFFNVDIVTNQRIVDIDFDNLFNHRVSECQLEKIEDVTHSPVGMWSVIFDFGNVYIQTAAEQREFEFSRVPRARDVQDTINDLLEIIQSQ